MSKDPRLLDRTLNLEDQAALARQVQRNAAYSLALFQELIDRAETLESTVGAGDGVSGSFTTSDGKTVVVTDGVITSIT